MKVINACLLIFQLVAVPSHGTCVCGGAVGTNSTTLAPAPDSSPTLSPTPSDPDPAPSSGPSSGPAGRLLTAEEEEAQAEEEEGRRLLADLIDSRYLQEDNASDDNETTDAPEVTTTPSVEEECVCPPEVITTFTTTLTFGDPTELPDVDFAALKEAIITSGSFEDTDIAVATATIKVSMSYTFEGATAVTSDECISGVASAYGVAETKVMCTEGAAATTTENVTTTTAAAATTPAARRLDAHGGTTAVMDVEISFAEDEAEAALTAALMAPPPVVVTGQTVTAPLATVVIVEFVLVVTSDEVVDAPSVADVETALTDFEFTVTVDVSAPEISYTRMPCSASETVCASGYDMRSGSESIGCAGDECTDDDRETCCTQVATAGAHGTCMLGSLTVLALSCNFAF